METIYQWLCRLAGGYYPRWAFVVDVAIVAFGGVLLASWLWR